MSILGTITFRTYVYAFVCMFATPEDTLPYKCVDTAFESPVIRDYHNGPIFPLPWERKSGTMVMGGYRNGRFVEDYRVSYTSADYTGLENTPWYVIVLTLVADPNTLSKSGFEENFYEFTGLQDI